MPQLPKVPGLKDAIEEFRAAVAKSFGPRLTRAVLFGSVARGRMSEDSDIDVLLLLATGTGRDSQLATNAACAVMLDHPEFVFSPLVLTQERFDDLRSRERRIALDIEREGILL